jgi:hypothetical protein
MSEQASTVQTHKQTIDDADLVLLGMLTDAHGLSEVLWGLARVCSDRSLALAKDDAHRATEWMRNSVELDNLAAEIGD